MYAIKNDDRRKMHIQAVTFPNNPTITPKTFYCPAYPAQPGYNNSSVYVGFAENLAGVGSVFELDDNMTKIYYISGQLPQQAPEGWIYECKIVSSHTEAFIDPELLLENAEAAVVMTQFKHDWSETGPTVNFQFDGWGHSYMTLQRVRMSVSGTAEAMESNGAQWIEHNGSVGFLTVMQDKMLEQAAWYHEYQILSGKGTVDMDGNTIMTNKENDPVMAGDGILHANEGAYEYPYNKWSLSFLEGIMQEGLLEILLLCGRKSAFEFDKLMVHEGFRTSNHNIEDPTVGADKVVINSYKGYEIGNARIIPVIHPWFDDAQRPTKWLSDGTRKSSWDAFIIPVGDTPGGDPSFEVCQLRAPKLGTVNGMNKGGEMATSVDGKHIHYLFQSGIICRAKVGRIFRPYPYQSKHVYFN